MKKVFEQVLKRDLCKRLTQHYEMLLGTYYWVNDAPFVLDDHFAKHPTPVRDEPALLELMCSEAFTPIPFKDPRGKREISPWRVLFVEDYLEDHSAWILLFHHAIGDGISIFTNIVNCSDRHVDFVYKLLPRKPVWNYILAWLVSPLLLTYYYTKLKLTARTPKIHDKPLSGIRKAVLSKHVDLHLAHRVCR